MPVARLFEWRMTTRDWQEFAASGDMMAQAITLANGGAARDQSRLFRLPTHVPHLYNWMLRSEHVSRWECDDYLVGVSSGDFWKVFVR